MSLSANVKEGETRYNWCDISRMRRKHRNWRKKKPVATNLFSWLVREYYHTYKRILLAAVVIIVITGLTISTIHGKLYTTTVFLRQTLLLRNVSKESRNIFPWIPPVYRDSVIGNVFHTSHDTHSFLEQHTANLTMSSYTPLTCSLYFQDALILKYVLPNFYGNSCRNRRFRTTISLLLVIDFNQTVKYGYFERIKRISEKWKSSISLVVYFESSSNNVDYREDDFRRALHDVFTQFQLQMSTICVHVVISEEKMTYLPINTLRNVAMRFSSSDVVFLSEVDIILPSNLDVVISKYVTNLHYMNKEAFIVPVFSSKTTEPEVPDNKLQLLTLWSNNVTLPLYGQYVFPLASKWITPQKAMFFIIHIFTFTSGTYSFHTSKFAEDISSHYSTNYTHYKSASELYQVKHKGNYEPYYVVNRRIVPSYPEILQFGYMDKSIHSWILYILEFKFFVIPDAFMIHIPQTVRYPRDDKILPCANIADEDIKRIVLDSKQHKTKDIK